MVWFIFGLIYTFFQAVFNEFNRKVQIDSWQLNFLHCFFAAVFFTLCAPFMSIPMEADFWLCSLVTASIVTIGCQVQIQMAAKHNGRVGAMWHPLSIFITFIAWIGLFPETAAHYMRNPVILIAIMVSFALNIFSIVLIRRNDIGVRALLLMIPIAVLYAVSAILAKYIMPEENALSEALGFGLLSYVFMTLLSFTALVATKKMEKGLFSPNMVKCGVVIGFSSALAYLFMLLSISASPNPAFTGVLGALVPVWIMIYHRFHGVKDDASPIAGTVMVFSAIILLLVTA